MIYAYYKAKTIKQSKGNNKNNIKKNAIKTLPNILIVVGATAVTSVLYPFLSHKLTQTKWQAKIEDPATPVVAYQEKEKGPEIISDIDYTKPSNWFVQPIKNTRSNILDHSSPSTYTISIPKIDVKNMTVLIGGEDLDEHLIQYDGTSLPGQLGNPVIFGHSLLPVFYNPKNYASVFTKIPTLEKNDEIFVNYDNVNYKYKVQSYHEVEPDQVELLEQKYDRRTLTLVTCVPPGTYLRRGVILATLEEN